MILVKIFITHNNLQMILEFHELFFDVLGEEKKHIKFWTTIYIFVYIRQQT